MDLPSLLGNEAVATVSSSGAAGNILQRLIDAARSMTAARLFAVRNSSPSLESTQRFSSARMRRSQLGHRGNVSASRQKTTQPPMEKLMEQCVARVDHTGHAATEEVDFAANGQAIGVSKNVSSRVALLKPRYTLPDFDRTWQGKFLQMVVDRLHSRGD